MQPGGSVWIGVIERSSATNPADFAEANPLGGRRNEHLWLRGIGAAGVYLHRDDQKRDAEGNVVPKMARMVDADGNVVLDANRNPRLLKDKDGNFVPSPGYFRVTAQPQQSPGLNGEFQERPKNFAVIGRKPKKSTTFAFGANDTHLELGFADDTCFAAAEDTPETYVRERPVLGTTAGETEPMEGPIKVIVMLHIDERTYPNGTYVDESTVTIKVEDRSIAPPNEPFQTFEMPFRMKMRALLPCVGLSRGCSVQLECNQGKPRPRIETSQQHVHAHWDLGRFQSWRDVQQFELARRMANPPKIDVDRSIRFAQHSVVPRKAEQLPPKGLDSQILGYLPRETQNRSSFVGHITRLRSSCDPKNGVEPPMLQLPKWGSDVLPIGPAFLPYDEVHEQRVRPYGYIPSLGYTYVTGQRAKHDEGSAKRNTEAFGVFAKSRSMSSLRKMRSATSEAGLSVASRAVTPSHAGGASPARRMVSH